MKEASLPPSEARGKITAGYERFKSGASTHGSGTNAERRQALLGGQAPYATVLTCADSRLCPEHIFDAGLGDVFVCRNAGNLVDELAPPSGFADAVQQSQAIFRCVLDAMARPGTCHEIPDMPYAPPPLNAASTANALTLLDDSTPVWLDPIADTAPVREFLAFHCGCPIVATPNDFGGIGSPPTHPALLDWLASEFAARAAVRRPARVRTLAMVTPTGWVIA